MKTRPWVRKLWGIKFTSGDKSDQPMLLGGTWDKVIAVTYEGEPARALLFTKRKLARAWCRTKNKEWKQRGDILSKWRVRPVRVTKIISEI